MEDKEWDFITDDDPDFIAYLAETPPLEPPTKEDLKRLSHEWKRIGEEQEAIRDEVLSFHTAFSGLEQSLSVLLHNILNAGTSRVAYAIYYSPTSFDARAELVGNALIQIATEQKQLVDLLPYWKAITAKMQGVRRLRNAIAHSAPANHSIKGKIYARLAPPAFDVIRIRRKIEKGQIPGLTAQDIRHGSKKVRYISEGIDRVNRLVAEFRDGNPSLLRRYAALAAHPMAGHSPAQSAQSAKSPPKRQRQQPPSGG